MVASMLHHMMMQRWPAKTSRLWLTSCLCTFFEMSSKCPDMVSALSRHSEDVQIAQH